MPAIEHVVVLMFENRSFDSMLGKLYPTDGTFDGLSGAESNVFAGRSVPGWSREKMDPLSACIPDPDPGELFADMNTQLFGNPAGSGAVTMGGFVSNYISQKSEASSDPRAPMHYFRPEQLPVMSTLAKAFGVSDRWYASAPCQTWPNRFFAHTATALGCVNNSQFPIPFPAPSIFRRLESHNKTWRVYFHDLPQSLLLEDLWLVAPLHFRFMGQFFADAHTGALPNYSFIEPRYFANPIVREIPSDQHPPHDVVYGEQLLALVYNALRQSPCWKKTLFVVTYDEHGGTYDHLSPPSAISTDANSQNGFTFNRYGVRVPALIISPYVAQGSKIRPTNIKGAGTELPFPFDHTSIIATLRKVFDLGDPFTARDSVAPDLLPALNLASPVNLGPPTVSVPIVPVTTARSVASATMPSNHMQANLARMAYALPVGDGRQFTPTLHQIEISSLPLLATIARDRVKAFLRA